MMNNWQQIRERVEERIMAKTPTKLLPRIQHDTLRIFYAVIRDTLEGQLTLRAMSLVYTTLLSLVPLLALSFSVLKAFGVQSKVEPLLFDLLSRMGAQGAEIGQTIMGFVNNIKVGLLGAAGLALLFYTVISLLQKIERSLNFIWRVDHSRNITRKFSDYLSVILVGPVLIFTALGITGSVNNSSIVQSLSSTMLIGDAIHLIGTFVPYILIIAAFTFVYMFMPNTQVKFRSALLGATVAGVLWESTNWLFASFVVSSSNYAAIYSSFAILILFMIWLYLGWLILLLGAEVAFYYQHPRVLHSAMGRKCAGLLQREQICLQIMYLVGDHFLQGKPAWSEAGLAEELSQPLDLISNNLERLCENNVLCITGERPITYMPMQDISCLPISQILDVAQGSDKLNQLDGNKAYLASDFVLTKIQNACAESLHSQTLKDLVLQFNNSTTDKSESTNL